MFSFNRIRVLSIFSLVLFCCFCALSAHAQGLVGAPVDPRYGQSSPVGTLADYGYDNARNIVLAATAVGALAACGIAWLRRKKVSRKRFAVELAALALIPTFVYFAGTFMINDVGGLGGCPVAWQSQVATKNA